MTLTVEHVTTTRGGVDYYRVSTGANGGDMVTVRVGFHGQWACLTCLTTTCAHSRAAEDFARAASASTTAAA